MKVFLVGHYGGQNTGDQAMLLACLRFFQRQGFHTYFVIKHLEDMPLAISNESTTPVTTQFWDVWRSLKVSDWVVLGGGTHFHDDYKLPRLVRHLRYMTVLSCLFLVAKLMGKRVAWISIGIGPLKTFVGRLIFGSVLRSVDFIAVRDRGSLLELESFGYKPQTSLAFDLAACLIDELPPRTTDGGSETRTPRTLGISPTLLHGSEARVGMASVDFWDACSAEVAALAKRRDLAVRVFQFRGGSRESDSGLVDVVVRRLKSEGVHDIEIVPYATDPTKTLYAIRECSWVVASRFHSAMFAYLTGRPMLMVPYHKKLLDLAEEIDLPKDAVLPLDGSASKAVFREALTALVDHPERFLARRPVRDAIQAAHRNFSMFLQR